MKSKKTNKKIPVIFFHGFTGSAKSWDLIRKNLSCSSLAFDIPGHGHNHFNDFSKPYTFEDWNHEFLIILNQKKLPKINLCGYSMGGRLAISFAIAFPEKIESLILVSTTAGLKNQSKKEYRLFEDLKLSKEINIDFQKFISEWGNSAFFSKQKYSNGSLFQNKLARLRHS